MAQATAAASATHGKPFYQSLYVQVLTAIAVGIALGHFYPQLGEQMKPLGDGFIKLIKMIIAPIIFCTVVVGIAGMEDMKKVGKTGGLALIYFEVVSTLALLIGLVVVNVAKPGAGVNADPATLDAAAVAQYADKTGPHGVADFILNIMPTTLANAFATGEVLQVLLVSVLFGFALHALGGRGDSLFQLIERLSNVLFRIVGYIMRLAPIGAFGAMAFTIGKYGVGSLLSLGKLMGTFYLTCLVFILVVLGLIARFHGFAILKFIRYIKEELLIVLGTSSSESVLPRMMAKLENLGAKKSVVGLVIPTGYSFNLDGTSIYLTMAAVFIAQATNTPLSFGDLMLVLGVSLITSKGAHGVPGSAIVILAVAHLLVLPKIFAATLGEATTTRVLISVLLLAPLAFFMGMPFPSAIRSVDRRASHFVPWAWGVNGGASMEILRMNTRPVRPNHCASFNSADIWSSEPLQPAKAGASASSAIRPFRQSLPLRT
jgi:aerobic C4-dicarboxylate transport protein